MHTSHPNLWHLLGALVEEILKMAIFKVIYDQTCPSNIGKSTIPVNVSTIPSEKR